MTREEVKTIILKHQFAFASMPNEVIEALNYLINEEQEPSSSENPNKSEILTGSTTKENLAVDCISRVDVLNNLANIAKVKAKSDAQKSLMGRCMFMVEHIPSVIPQEPQIRPKGHWIDRWDKVMLCEDKNCSVCGYLAQTKHNYCPNCGADMREGEE